MDKLTNQEIAAMIGVRVCTAKAYDGFMRHAIKADCGAVIDRIKPSQLRDWLVYHAQIATA